MSEILRLYSYLITHLCGSTLIMDLLAAIAVYFVFCLVWRLFNI